MLSRIDDFIYPNRCEVIEFGPQRYFYPIFKNASSSVLEQARRNGCKLLVNQQISRCSEISIILRDPTDRFLSGTNAFLFNLTKDNPQLDRDTVLYFIENYLYLDRHYAPQMSWLVHLHKYTNKTCRFRLLDMTGVKDYTDLHIDSNEDKILTAEETARLSNNIHNELYRNIDRYLLDLCGQSVLFDEILKYIKSKDINAYLKCAALD